MAKTELMREEEGPGIHRQQRGAGRRGGQAASLGAVVKVEAGYQPLLRGPLTQIPLRMR